MHPMRAVMVAVTLGLVLVACGGSSSGTAATTALPEWLVQFGVPLVRAEPVNGHDVWLDDKTHIVYVEDCATAKAITAQGQPYGPSAGTSGWAYICRT
jgi:hypothetical protein